MRVEELSLQTLGETGKVYLRPQDADALDTQVRSFLDDWRNRGVTHDSPGGIIIFDFAKIYCTNFRCADRIAGLASAMVESCSWGDYLYFGMANLTDLVREELNAALRLRNLVGAVVGLGQRVSAEDAHIGDKARVGAAMPVLETLHTRGDWMNKQTIPGAVANARKVPQKDRPKYEAAAARYLKWTLWDKLALVIEDVRARGRSGPVFYRTVASLNIPTSP